MGLGRFDQHWRTPVPQRDALGLLKSSAQGTYLNAAHVDDESGR